MATRCTSRAYVAAVLFLTIVSTAPAQYSGGTGEPNDPYQIATAADLIALGEEPNDYDKHFILTADIDLDPNLPGRKVFDKAIIAPHTGPVHLVFQGTPFTGVFHGNGHAISHLTINGVGHLGLFGRLSGATVKDLGVVDVNINGSDWWGPVGALAGDNCGSIAASYSTGVVSGGNCVGGLVGDNGGIVTRSRSAAAVTGTSYYIGGLVGVNAGDVVDCFGAGPVSGGISVGGLVGENGDITCGRVMRSYSTGAVRGSSFVGGLVGSDSGGEVVASFWDTQTSGRAVGAGGTGRTTAEMQTAKTFLDAGWDFVGEAANGTEDIWKIAEGLGYPRLAWEKYGGGTGEPNDPYQIATAADLIALGETPEDYDKHFILTADIDLDPNLPGGRVFDKAVIASATLVCGGSGCVVVGVPFEGVFDGNGHKISCLTIRGENYLGLFGRLGSTADVSNLGLDRVDVTGTGGDVGGLVGSNGPYPYEPGGTLVGCYSTGAVTGDWSVGGLVGHNGGTLTACESATTVDGGWSTGGLVGVNTGVVSQCQSTGLVSGSYGVGGLVGDNDDGSVTNCYSMGAVSGLESASFTGGVGGLVGLNTGDVTHCYSTGVVQGFAVFTGGLVGVNHVEGDFGSATDSFWDMQTSGQATSRGGTGKTTAEMQMQSTFTDAGWDFMGETANGTEDIWWILEGKDYPRLWWELDN